MSRFGIFSFTLFFSASLFGQTHLHDDSWRNEYLDFSAKACYASSDFMLADEQIYSAQAKDLSKRKSPGVAFVLSLILPGAGQYYNGDVAKGVAMDVWIAGGFALILYDSGLNERYSSSRDKSPSLDTFGAIMVISGSLWSMIDAPISASKKNKKAEREFGHLVVFGSIEHAVGFDFGYYNKGVGTQLTYHF
jgi:hypothetical protein